MKPGIHTSEFKITVALIALWVIGDFAQFIPGKYAALVAGGAGSRRKLAETTGIPETTLRRVLRGKVDRSKYLARLEGAAGQLGC